MVVTRLAVVTWLASPRPPARNGDYDTTRGRAEYRQRGRTIEPVFGQLKTASR